MTHECQLTEISKKEFPELIQFYHHFPQKYPFLLTTSSKKTSHNSIHSERHKDSFFDGQSSGYDILFIEPEEWLKLDKQFKLSTTSPVDIESDDLFLDAFDKLFAAETHAQIKFTHLKTPHLKNTVLPFTGGWFVFLAYELAQQIEPCLNLPLEEQQLPVAYAARVKKALIYDHKKKNLFFMSEMGVEHEQCLESLKKDAKNIRASARGIFPLDKQKQSLQEENDDFFINSVSKVKKYIREGDVFQVNLSRLWQTNHGFENHLMDAYSLSQRLSKENPAPFSGLANIATELGMATIISSSPERLLKVKNNILESRPIAGTHPRSVSEKEDLRLLSELHAHPKEQAEHIMLIDLIRNDLGRVCEPGTVIVDELMVNESYAHVHHIVSNVRGELQPNKTPGEVIKAMFPGGTITGCPKVRCMEIIAELEQHSRGAYTGSMGYVNLNGSMDLNILIRTMVLESFSGIKECKLSFRAGAGLVFDSLAEKELAETRVKAKGMLQSLKVI